MLLEPYRLCFSGPWSRQGKEPRCDRRGGSAKGIDPEWEGVGGHGALVQSLGGNEHSCGQLWPVTASGSI